MEDMAMTAFAISVGFIVYTIAGYPLVLALMARVRRPAQEARPFTPRTVTVLLAVHNGETWIARKLQSLLALDYPQELLHVLVLDDGSTDGTAAAVRRVTDPRVELVSLPHGGKARALNAGMARATGDVLLFTDVRQRLHPQSLRRLVGRFAEPRVGVVSGELEIEASNQDERSVGLYWRYDKWIRRHQGLVHSMTGATGSIYAMRRELAVPLPPDTLVDDMYLPLSAGLRGSWLVFEPEAKAYDCGTTPAEEFRRKVRTLAGNVQILRALPRLLWPSHRTWFHFVSHKLTRLVLPYAALTACVTGLRLPSPADGIVLSALAVYGFLALADSRIPTHGILKRTSSITRTSAVLLAAAACAPLAVLRGRQALWRPVVAAPGRSMLLRDVRGANWRRSPAVGR